MNTQIKLLQDQLKAAGFDPGTSDGILGRKTFTAISAFQKVAGLRVDGVAGKLTLAALAARTKASTPASVVLPWMAEAERFLGLKEAAGTANNKTIMGWGAEGAAWIKNFYKGDDIPWCGLFVAHCIGFSLPIEPMPSNPLGALNWNTFGVGLKTPMFGCIGTFKRTGGGHVGFLIGQDDTTFTVLGGNQSDSVSKARILKSRLAGLRWPSKHPVPTVALPTINANGALSTNEK